MNQEGISDLVLSPIERLGYVLETIFPPADFYSNENDVKESKNDDFGIEIINTIIDKILQDPIDDQFHSMIFLICYKPIADHLLFNTMCLHSLFLKFQHFSDFQKLFMYLISRDKMIVSVSDILPFFHNKEFCDLVKLFESQEITCQSFSQEDIANFINDHSNKYSDEQTCCKICFQYKSKVTFYPCGHLGTCLICSNDMTSCPFCLVSIEKKIKTFQV